MSQVSLIPSLQFEALAREVERQLTNESSAVIAAAESDARAIIAQARAEARRRVHESIQELRREGARRLTRAKAQLEAEQRARAQRQAAQAVNDGFPLLREELEARWRDQQSRRQWTDAVARLCVLRLRPGAWLIEHPANWSGSEQRDFTATIGERDGVHITFKADGEIKSGLRIKADQAVLDATPQGLLADSRTIAALILDEIGQE
jgi:vacuolar-type H+-ATPase subunit H